jgi:para-nitrobenzyl esterase
MKLQLLEWEGVTMNGCKLPVFRFITITLALSLAALSAPMAAQAPAAGNPLVRKTKWGYIEGKAVTGIETTNKAWAWLGVPYAKPPVGELRWKAPRDPAPWSGIRPAKTLPGPSKQMGGFINNLDYETFNKPVGSEDSLYLNVWTPRKTWGRRPVVFWIHGGGNFQGESATPTYDGANFASENDTVFVSLNYRLGKLGWFAAPALRTGDPLDDSANYGTLDMIKALTWVKNNIATFGGDPKNVTIIGQSGGSMDIHSLLVAPLARGLFHRAVAMSGTPMSTDMKTAKEAANATVRGLIIKDGYASNDQEAEQFMAAKGNAWIASYLRSKPAEAFLQPTVFDADFFDPTNMISIVEDGYVFPKGVRESIKSGNYAKVPIILSSCKEETKFFLPLVIGKMDDKGFAKMAREADIDDPGFQAGNTGVPLQTFLDPVWWPIYNPLNQWLTSMAIKRITNGYCFIMSKQQKNVYTYQFNWDEEPKPLDFVLGSAHAMDIPFLFHNFDIGDSQISRVCWCEKTRKSREVLSRAMTRYLAQFMRTGNPNRRGLPVWEPVANGKANTMMFDTPFP